MPDTALPSRGPLYMLDGIMPKIAPDAFVAPNAAVIGDVEIGPLSGIWFNCVVRGDVNFIRIGARSNVQDGTVIHVNSGARFFTRIGDDVTIGHAAIIHACELHNHAFIGMGSTVLDGAVVEEGGMLAAGALLTPGKRIGPNELWQGSPARLARVLDAEERAKFGRIAQNYVGYAQRYLKGLGAG